MIFALIFILAAFALFLVTRHYGRIWCGFTCPQTIWTLGFNWVERRIEGNHNQSRQLDSQAFNVKKATIKTAKHSVWIAISMLTATVFMSRIWGIKLLAQIIDGTYETHGPNPYKYPDVAGFAGLELMDLINTIRDKLDEGAQIDVPLFVAHSQADATTPIHGVERLIKSSKGPNTFFVIDESYALCHADLVVSPQLLQAMQFNASMVNQQEMCAVPKANPLFSTMDFMLREYAKQF